MLVSNVGSNFCQPAAPLRGLRHDDINCTFWRRFVDYSPHPSDVVLRTDPAVDAKPQIKATSPVFRCRTKQYMSDADWSPPMLYLPFNVCQEMCASGLLPRGLSVAGYKSVLESMSCCLEDPYKTKMFVIGAP